MTVILDATKKVSAGEIENDCPTLDSREQALLEELMGRTLSVEESHIIMRHTFLREAVNRYGEFKDLLAKFDMLQKGKS